MATVTTIEPLREWPYEYEGWRITFKVNIFHIAHTQPFPGGHTGQLERGVEFLDPRVEHLHDYPGQSIRWTKRRELNKRTMQMGELKDELCCFICAEYMPCEVWNYFERCKEITRCANL